MNNTKFAVAKIASYINWDLAGHYWEGIDKLNFIETIQQHCPYLNNDKFNLINTMSKNKEEFYKITLNKVLRDRWEISLSSILNDLEVPEKVRYSFSYNKKMEKIKKDTKKKRINKRSKFGLSKLSKYFAKTWMGLPNSQPMNIADFINILEDIGIHSDNIQHYKFKWGGVKKDYDNLFKILYEEKWIETIKRILEHFELPKSFIREIDYSSDSNKSSSTPQPKSNIKKIIKWVIIGGLGCLLFKD